MVPYRTVPPSPGRKPPRTGTPTRSATGTPTRSAQLGGLLLAALLALIGCAAPSASALAAEGRAAAPATEASLPADGPSAPGEGHGDERPQDDPPSFQGALPHTAHSAGPLPMPLLPPRRQPAQPPGSPLTSADTQESATHLAHHSPHHGRAPPPRAGTGAGT